VAACGAGVHLDLIAKAPVIYTMILADGGAPVAPDAAKQHIFLG
jgi:hypothetical protein